LFEIIKEGSIVNRIKLTEGVRLWWWWKGFREDRFWAWSEKWWWR